MKQNTSINASEIDKSLLMSNKTRKQHEYIKITQLPTGFRSYRTREIPITHVLVRGLVFSEITSLQKLHETDLDQLKLIYQDVIIFPEDPMMTLGQLELIDFLTLIIISSLYTVTDFHWSWAGKCLDCSTPMSRALGLGDVEFEVNDFNKLPLDIMLKDTVFTDAEGNECSQVLQLRMITVDDVIEIKSKNLSPEEEMMYEIAYSLSCEGISREDILSYVYNFSYNDMVLVQTIIRELKPKTPFFAIKCPSCNLEMIINFDLSIQNIIPSFELEDLYKLSYIWQKTFNSTLDTQTLYYDIIKILDIHKEVVEEQNNRKG